MSQPRMSEGQRIVAVEMLANAIRKQEFGTGPPRGLARAGDLARLVGARGRTSSSERYVRGMVDLLAVLFEGGRPFAEECYREARRLALGQQSPGSQRPDLN